MKTMRAVIAVQLFILVWTFTAVCRAEDHISVRCKNVTGTVGEEVTLTCSVSLTCSNRCITVYKFQHPEIYNYSEICREEVPPGSCEQRNSFTCRFTPTTVMTGQFRFFIQTVCGNKITEFTVNITDTEQMKKGNPEKSAGNDLESKTTVIAAVTGCFTFIIIIIIIIMVIIYKKTSNYIKPCGFQRRIFLGHKHDDNNSNIQEQNPDNVI